MSRPICLLIVVLIPLVSTTTELNGAANNADQGLGWNQNCTIAGTVSDDYHDVSKINPKNAAMFNSMAWMRATCPQEKYRDGNLAVQYATKACTISGWKNPIYLSTLAVSYAELEDFKSAVEWQERAMELAPSAKKKQYMVLLERFRDGKPYRDIPKGSTKR